MSDNELDQTKSKEDTASETDDVKDLKPPVFSVHAPYISGTVLCFILMIILTFISCSITYSQNKYETSPLLGMLILISLGLSILITITYKIVISKNVKCKEKVANYNEAEREYEEAQVKYVEWLMKNRKAEDLEIKENIIEKSINENKIGATLKIIGWITITMGILIGIIVCSSFSDSNSNSIGWVYGIAIIISSFVSGILFIGFGEVIILLDKIKNNTSKE